MYRTINSALLRTNGDVRWSHWRDHHPGKLVVRYFDAVKCWLFAIPQGTAVSRLRKYAGLEAAGMGVRLDRICRSFVFAWALEFPV
jgi:hypothetical protein